MSMSANIRRVDEMAWVNIIRIRSENDRDFANYVLAARSDFLKLRLRQDEAIRTIYRRSATNVYDEIMHITLQGKRDLRKAHLKALQKAIEQEANRIGKSLQEIIEGNVLKAVEIGSDPFRRFMGDCLTKAGADFSWLKLQRGFGSLNSAAAESFFARTRHGIFLSDRIWLESEKARRAITLVVQDGIVRGLDAVKVAKSVEGYLLVRTPVTEFRNMMERMGGRIPKDLSYEALRMARTEVSIAHMEGLYSAGRTMPSYKGVMWCLSAAHPIADECDDLADADLYGMGSGVYPEGEEPVIPHPNCLCYVVPVMEETDEFVGRLKQWLDDPSAQPDIEQWYNNIYGGITGKGVGVPARPTVLKSPKDVKPEPGTRSNPIKYSGLQTLGGGISKTYTGIIDGKKYLFKSTDNPLPGHFARNNLEAELLSEKILNACGVTCPKTNYAWFEGPDGKKNKFLTMEWVEDGMSARDYDQIGLLNKQLFDTDTFRRMQVVDLLIGNIDRHEGNFLLKQDGSIVPIDHNLAMMTEKVVPGMSPRVAAFRDNLDDKDDYVMHILSRSRYGDLAIIEAGTIDVYRDITRDIQKTLTKEDIKRFVKELPRDLADRERKEELERILTWRLENLGKFFE